MVDFNPLSWLTTCLSRIFWVWWSLYCLIFIFLFGLALTRKLSMGRPGTNPRPLWRRMTVWVLVSLMLGWAGLVVSHVGDAAWVSWSVVSCDEPESPALNTFEVYDVFLKVWVHTPAPYSKIERVRAIYAVRLHCSGQNWRFRRSSPSTAFAFLVVLLMCGVHFRSSDRMIPRYFSWGVCFRICHWYCRNVMTLGQMLITWHFEVLNLIPHVHAHSWSLDRSSCNLMWSRCDLIGLYRTQSSANNGLATLLRQVDHLCGIRRGVDLTPSLEELQRRLLMS